jgi:hypothetical protein
MTTVLGVDFSGATTAGDTLWVTEVTQTTAGTSVTDCYRATDRWGRDRERTYTGLTERITDTDVQTVGLDFPFSLPQQLLDALCNGTWQGFLEWACTDGPDTPKAFSQTCRQTASEYSGKRDLRRETDSRRGALCPYTNRVRNMTYYGAKHVLARLADRTDTAVIPMQEDSADTVVCEVYPAATFGWLGCYREGYKNTDGARTRRQTNVTAIQDCSVALADHQETYLSSHDALDSLAAALSASRVDSGVQPQLTGTKHEGCIYV